jgi:hypothetical protein
MVQVEYSLFGDARDSVREFTTYRKAQKFMNAVFIDGGVVGRIVWVAR